MKNNFKFMEVREFNPLKDKDSGYQDGDYFYSTPSLIQATKDQKCKKFKHYLKSATFGVKEWDFVGIAEHYLRIKKANTKYPIIMTPNGWVCDGQHRIIKALIEQKEFVWAYRLNKMPEPIEK